MECRTFAFEFPIPYLKPPCSPQQRETPKTRKRPTEQPDYEAKRRRDPERQEYHRLYQRERRERLKAAGQCTRCKADAAPGQTLCESCANSERLRKSVQGEPKKPATNVTLVTTEEELQKRREYERLRQQRPERQEAHRKAEKERRQRSQATRLVPTLRQ